MSKAVAAAALIVTFAAEPQEPPNVMGQVVSAEGATQNGNPLQTGATIFEEDAVNKGASGKVVVKLSATSQAELRATLPCSSHRF